MSRLPSTLLLASFGLAALASAQNRIVLPSLFADVYGRGSSAALGGSSTRTQMVFASPFPANTTVLAVGLRATGGTVDRAAFTADLEVRASSTASAPGALSATFSANVGSDEVVVLPRQMVNIPAMPANRSAGLFAQLPFATPFVFGTNGNTNINVELLVYGRSTGATWSTDRCFASANGMASTVGRGCGTATINSTSTNGTYVQGSTINMTLAGATANGFAWLMPSVDMDELAPGVPLPFSLSLIGGGACDLLVSPLLFLPSPVDGSGASALSIPVGTLNRLNTGWQWIYTVPTSGTNPLGLETTAARRILIGPEECVPVGQYVWDLSNVNSLTGNNTTDSVPIVQFTLQ
jgi:hypothetical protein